MKTNLNPMSLYKRPRLQHMKRLAVTALTAVMLSGLVAGCDLTDPVIASRVIVEPPPPVDDGRDDDGRDDDGRDDDGRDDDRRDDDGPACSSASQSLAGTWNLIGYSDDGTELETTGIWSFRTNGTLTIQATIGGRNSSGEFTYNQTGLDLAITDVRSYAYPYDIHAAGNYSLSFCGNDVTLTSVDAPLIYTLNAIH